MKDMSTRLTEKKVARERAFEMKMKVEKEAWEAILAKVHHQFRVYILYVQCTVYSVQFIVQIRYSLNLCLSLSKNFHFSHF